MYFLKNSLLNGYNSFCLYQEDSNKEYKDIILTFITGFNKNQNYYDSLINVILNSNEKLLMKLITYNKELDINQKGILKELINIINGKKIYRSIININY